MAASTSDYQVSTVLMVKDLHHGIRASDIFRFGAGEDQAVVAVLELGHVHIKNLGDVI